MPSEALVVSPEANGDTHADQAIEKPKVVVTTPYYGDMAPGWAEAYLGASKRRDAVDVVMSVRSKSSVLPGAFNQCLAIALDLRDAGKATHWAMLHSDMEAEPGWLDVIWGEMWTYGADVMSAVVPIKNDSGRTSTAIGDVNDRWHIKRCVRMEDRKTLPVTFSAKNVCQDGEVLLVNTGLFLADLRKPWWDDFAFQFHSRIRNTPDGRIAEVRSEDWEMSHHLHEHGARYMATWRPKLKHHGQYQWANY